MIYDEHLLKAYPGLQKDMTTLDIKEYLNLLPNDNDTLYYFPNPGNAGDSLIAYATFKIFKEINLNYRTLTTNNYQEFDPKNKILIYGGGGNLVNNNNDWARNIIHKFHRQVRKLIILPHTINTHEDLLRELGSNVEIICREEVSYNHVKNYASKVNKVMLMEDLAFSLNVEDILHNKPMRFLESVAFKAYYKLTVNERCSSIPSPRIRMVNSYQEIKQYINQFIRNDKTLNCFRTDGEKTTIYGNNLDLSRLYMYGTDNEEVAFYTCQRLLSFMRQWDEIKTNRLHIGIAGALLGKKVKFYANNYYKCKAVYEYSMKNRFPNVQWMG